MNEKSGVTVLGRRMTFLFAASLVLASLIVVMSTATRAAQAQDFDECDLIDFDPGSPVSEQYPDSPSASDQFPDFAQGNVEQDDPSQYCDDNSVSSDGNNPDTTVLPAGAPDVVAPGSSDVQSAYAFGGTKSADSSETADSTAGLTTLPNTGGLPVFLTIAAFGGFSAFLGLLVLRLTSSGR